jgi:integrase
MSRRIIVSVGNAKPEIRQSGHIYQKSRKRSDPWLPTQRAYGFFRIDVPGQSKQNQIRVPLGFCRDRDSAVVKLHQEMQKAGVLDPEKIRERINPTATFRKQAAWMIEEMEAGRIVNRKTREPIGERTIDFYSNAIAYLNDVVGDRLLPTLENPEARDLVARMKLETVAEGRKRFGDSGKTIVEYFKTFQKVIASATDEQGNQLHPRKWNLTFISLPKVNERKQHCPTLVANEITHIVANTRGKYRVASAILAGSNIRISELLALRIEKHISDDRRTLFIRQQRRKQRCGVTDQLKTPAAYRDVDIHSALANMLDDYVGRRKEGFLFETKNGKMLSPETLFRDGFKTVLKKMERTGVRFHAFRRFRESVLLASEARQILIDYWMGHENPDMSTRYGRQLVADVNYRKQWAEKVGLGFELPQVPESGLSVNCATCATSTAEQVCGVTA